jgi:hypothetical protein
MKDHRMSEQEKPLRKKGGRDFNLVQGPSFAPGVKLPTEKELCV